MALVLANFRVFSLVLRRRFTLIERRNLVDLAELAFHCVIGLIRRIIR